MLAVVGRLVDAHARFASGRAAIGLAGTQIERASGVVGGIERQRSDRSLIKIARMELFPIGIVRERVVRPPDAASGSADPDTAARCVAVGRNNHCGYSARCRVRRAGERRDAGLYAGQQRAVEAPLVPLCAWVASPCIGAGDAFERCLGVCDDGGRYHISRVRAHGRQKRGPSSDRTFARRRGAARLVRVASCELRHEWLAK